jgi:hypothetical protein
MLGRTAPIQAAAEPIERFENGDVLTQHVGIANHESRGRHGGDAPTDEVDLGVRFLLGRKIDIVFFVSHGDSLKGGQKACT